MSNHIGTGYGSEFHLMRYMGRFREELNNKIEKDIDGLILKWLDFKHKDKRLYNTQDLSKIILHDQEWEGIKFLGNGNEPLFKEWRTFWPKSGTQQNWDAIAQARIEQNNTWILIEAKAHTKEIESSCGAKSKKSIKTIESAFEKTRTAFGISTKNDWKQKYYQYANRLAVLYFLNSHGVRTKLIFIYFLGDKNTKLADGSICPKIIDEWMPLLKEQSKYLGLTVDLKKRLGIYDIFLDVCP